MRTVAIGLLLVTAATAARAQTPEQRELLTMSTTVYTAALTCPGGLDPDPTTTVAALLSANGIEPGDVAQGGRHFPIIRQIVVDLAEEMRGKAPGAACALLRDRYPRWIRPRTP
jgi:hypothetical protein